MLSSGAFPFQGSSVSCRAMSKGEGCPSPFSSNPAFQKPIQNPYGHQKNPYIRANQSTARNANQITEPLENTGVTAVSSPQTTTAQNTPKGTRNDEVIGSIPISSSRKTPRNCKVSGSFLFYYWFQPMPRNPYRDPYALKVSICLFSIFGSLQCVSEDVASSFDTFGIGVSVHS